MPCAPVYRQGGTGAHGLSGVRGTCGAHRGHTGAHGAHHPKKQRGTCGAHAQKQHFRRTPHGTPSNDRTAGRSTRRGTPSTPTPMGCSRDHGCVPEELETPSPLPRPGSGIDQRRRLPQLQGTPLDLLRRTPLAQGQRSGSTHPRHLPRSQDRVPNRLPIMRRGCESRYAPC